MNITTSSPPLTPVGSYLSPLRMSMSGSWREQNHRRSSSFSNPEPSPISTRHKHRFSNASQFSNTFSTPSDNGSTAGGLGNLADELDLLSDGDEYEEGFTDPAIGDSVDLDEDTEFGAGARDSGVDVSYLSKTSPSQHRKRSRAFIKHVEKPPDIHGQEQEQLSAEMEDAMASIARMTLQTPLAEDPLNSRTLVLLQDLGNQASLEAGAQRLTTSTNSLTSNLVAQSKQMQLLSTNLLGPLPFATLLDQQTLEDISSQLDVLIRNIPVPDPLPLQGLQKLSRENASILQTLSHLTDTLQMGKQTTNSAARHLRTTQTMVEDLRREREKADLARHELQKSNVERRLRDKTCAAECRDVMTGFEDFCAALRESLVSDAAVAMAA